MRCSFTRLLFSFFFLLFFLIHFFLVYSWRCYLIIFNSSHSPLFLFFLALSRSLFLFTKISYHSYANLFLFSSFVIHINRERWFFITSNSTIVVWSSSTAHTGVNLTFFKPRPTRIYFQFLSIEGFILELACHLSPDRSRQMGSYMNIQKFDQFSFNQGQPAMILNNSLSLEEKKGSQAKIIIIANFFCV